MNNISNNPLWPNGMKTDSEGYAIFYPLGTNKIPIPATASDWPEGSKLIFPFVYDENDKLVDFCDTKAMEIDNNNTIIDMPYTDIKADFSSIMEGTLTINTPSDSNVEIKWGSVDKVLAEKIEKVLEKDNCKVSFDKAANKATVAVALDTTESQLADVQSLLDRVLPPNLAAAIEWANGLPIDYTPLEYIESSGTQYIDTGILPKGSFKVAFSVLSRVWDGLNISNPVFFSYENTKWFFYSMNWQGIYLTAGQRGYGSQRYTLAYPPGHELNVRYDIVCDKNKTIRNGVEIGAINGEFVEEDFEFSRINIFLFNRTDDKSKPTSKVLYNFSIEDNGTPVVNYIPALNPEGQPGLYDTVSKVFKTNIGTGDFLYPGKETESTTYSLRNRMYAKLTEHGVRRLYHVPKDCTMTKDEYAIANEFKELVEQPMPSEGYWVPEWRETETQLILDWVETEPPVEEEIQ